MGYAGTMTVPDDRQPDVSTQPAPSAPATRRSMPQGMVPARERRRTKVERGFMRLVATGGIVGIAVALGAILASQDVAGWIMGLVIGLTSVILAALLWSSRQL
jgi:hypothetical protein